MFKTENYFQDKLDQYILLAIIFHGAILLVLVIGKFILNLEIFHLKHDKKEIRIVQSSVRVDIVGLPKYTLQELKKMNIGDATPEVEEEKNIQKVNETSDIEFKTKAKKVDLSNLLKSIGQKKIEHKVKKKEKKIDERVLKKLILEGNKVSQGSSFSGEQLDLSEQVFVSYIQQLPDKVKPNWKLPSYLLNQELQCRVQVFIGPDGRVLKINLFESSGEKEYDDKAINSIKLSSPFPKPPNSILSLVANGKVILGFPL